MTKSPDDVRNELKGMYLQAKIFGGGWREVAEMEPFKEAGISSGTLCSIAGGGDIPKRWWKLLPDPEQEGQGCRLGKLEPVLAPDQRRQDRHPKETAVMRKPR